MNRVGILSLERADVSGQGGTVFHPVKLLSVLLKEARVAGFFP